jgi:hypothetical protein
MAVVTTGSLTKGMVRGLGNHLEWSSISGAGPVVTRVYGSPDGILTCIAGSDIAVDWINKNYYIAKAGSTWYKLGSTT